VVVLDVINSALALIKEQWTTNLWWLVWQRTKGMGNSSNLWCIWGIWM